MSSPFSPFRVAKIALNHFLVAVHRDTVAKVTITAVMDVKPSTVLTANVVTAQHQHQHQHHQHQHHQTEINAATQCVMHPVPAVVNTISVVQHPIIVEMAVKPERALMESV